MAGAARVTIKDERGRMGLGSFKALGAAYAIAREAAAAGGALPTALTGRTYVTASAGNHGLSVAAGARIFGAAAVIYLADTVPESFAARLRGMGAQVVRAGADYEASMVAAGHSAKAQGWTLLSDGSWPGYVDLPFRVMEGYRQIATEIVGQMTDRPTHVLLQAGVGGLGDLTPGVGSALHPLVGSGCGLRRRRRLRCGLGLGRGGGTVVATGRQGCRGHQGQNGQRGAAHQRLHRLP